MLCRQISNNSFVGGDLEVYYVDYNFYYFLVDNLQQYCARNSHLQPVVKRYSEILQSSKNLKSTNFGQQSSGLKGPIT